MARLEQQFLTKPRNLKTLLNYLRSVGPRYVYRKVRSRLAERARNERYYAFGLGVTAPDEDGSKSATALVDSGGFAFIAPNHPRLVERVVVPKDFTCSIDLPSVVRAGDRLGRTSGAALAGHDRPCGRRALRPADLTIASITTPVTARLPDSGPPIAYSASRWRPRRHCCGVPPRWRRPCARWARPRSRGPSPTPTPARTRWRRRLPSTPPRCPRPATRRFRCRFRPSRSVGMRSTARVCKRNRICIE